MENRPTLVCHPEEVMWGFARTAAKKWFHVCEFVEISKTESSNKWAKIKKCILMICNECLVPDNAEQRTQFSCQSVLSSNFVALLRWEIRRKRTLSFCSILPGWLFCGLIQDGFYFTSFDYRDTAVCMLLTTLTIKLRLSWKVANSWNVVVGTFYAFYP